jgi:hypothetical protein
MKRKTVSPSVPAPLVRLYPPGLISLLTFLTAFPVGYILMIVNWHRMGKMGQARNYLFGMLFSTLFLITLLPYFPTSEIGALIFNVAFGIFFHNEMTQALTAFEQAGNSYSTEPLLTGCLIGVAAWIVWILFVVILGAVG